MEVYLADHPDVIVVDDSVYDSDVAYVVDSTGQTVEIIDEQSYGDDTFDDNLDTPSAATSGYSGTLSLSTALSHSTSEINVHTAATSNCVYTNAVFVNQAGWQLSVDGCTIIGWNWSATYYYNWVQDIYGWNSGPSCVQARGYSTSRTVSTPVWYTAGCGASGHVSAYIGNRATVTKIRGHVNAIFKIGYVRWK